MKKIILLGMLLAAIGACNEKTGGEENVAKKAETKNEVTNKEVANNLQVVKLAGGTTYKVSDLKKLAEAGISGDVRAVEDYQRIIAFVFAEAKKGEGNEELLNVVNTLNSFVTEKETERAAKEAALAEKIEAKKAEITELSNVDEMKKLVEKSVDGTISEDERVIFVANDAYLTEKAQNKEDAEAEEALKILQELVNYRNEVETAKVTKEIEDKKAELKDLPTIEEFQGLLIKRATNNIVREERILLQAYDKYVTEKVAAEDEAAKKLAEEVAAFNSNLNQQILNQQVLNVKAQITALPKIEDLMATQERIKDNNLTAQELIIHNARILFLEEQKNNGNKSAEEILHQLEENRIKLFGETNNN